MTEPATASVNWNRSRSLFPVTDQIAYLNHAGVAPISSRVEEALTRYSAEASQHGAFHYVRVIDSGKGKKAGADQFSLEIIEGPSAGYHSGAANITHGNITAHQ